MRAWGERCLVLVGLCAWLAACATDTEANRIDAAPGGIGVVPCGAVTCDVATSGCCYPSDGGTSCVPNDERHFMLCPLLTVPRNCSVFCDSDEDCASGVCAIRDDEVCNTLCVDSSMITATLPGYGKVCRSTTDCTADQKCCLTHPGSVPFGGCRVKTAAGCDAL